MTPVTPNVTVNDRVRIEVGSIVAKLVGAEEVGVEERGMEEVGMEEVRMEEVGREKVGMEEVGREEVEREEVGRMEERKEVGREEVGREERGRGEVGREEVGRKEVGWTELGERVEGEWLVDESKDGGIVEVDPDDSKVEDIVKLSVVRLLLLSLQMSPLPLLIDTVMLLPFPMFCSFEPPHLLAPTRKMTRICTTTTISVPILPCMSADHVRWKKN